VRRPLAGHAVLEADGGWTGRCSRHRIEELVNLAFVRVLFVLLLVGCGPPPGHGVLEVWVDPPVPVEIIIDGETIDVEDDERLRLDPGDREVCFGQGPGPGEPSCRSIEITAGTTHTLVIRNERHLEPSEAQPPDQDPPADAGPPGSEPPATDGRILHGSGLTPQIVGPRLPIGDLEVSGPVETTEDGEVIERLLVEVDGLQEPAISIRHDDVVIRDVVVRHSDGANGIVVDSSTTGGLIEFTHLDGQRSEHEGNMGSIGVLSYGEVDVYRVFIENGRDATHIYGGNSSIIESWVDSLHTNPDAHNDGLSYRGSSGSNVVIARNRINYNGERAGGITLFAERGPIRDTQVLDNLIVGHGKGFGLYGGWTHEERGHTDSNENIRIEGNRFAGEFQFPDVIGEGTNAGVNLSQTGNTFTNNRWVGSVVDVPPRCGVSADEC
jgi:hypothetical protein